MSMIETKGPRPYHVGRKHPLRMIGYSTGTKTFIERLKAKGYKIEWRPADWTEPKYPGDSIMIARLVKGDEFGDVRVQWYGNGLKPKDDDTLKVGTFLPGVVECPPGDTPKCWPEKSEYVYSKDEASRIFVQYVIEAFRDGWSVHSCT